MREAGDNREYWCDYGNCTQEWRDRHFIRKEENLGYVEWLCERDGHRTFDEKSGIIAYIYRFLLRLRRFWR